MREETICKICFNLLNDIDYHLKEAQEKTDDITNKFLDKEKDPLSYKPHQLIALSSSSPHPSSVPRATSPSENSFTNSSQRRRTTRNTGSKYTTRDNLQNSSPHDTANDDETPMRYHSRLDGETELIVGDCAADGKISHQRYACFKYDILNIQEL